MLSRASVLPRVCLSCRLGLAPRRATRRPSAILNYSTEPLPQSPDYYDGSELRPFEATMTKLVNDEYYHDFLVKKNLGLESLGKPVTALIIKNPDKLRECRRPLPVLDEGAPPTGTPLRVGDAIPKEDELGSESDDLAEAMKNLDGLRPKGTVALSLPEMKKLLLALDLGFNCKQLESYIASMEPNASTVAREGSLYPWIVKQQPQKAAGAAKQEPLTPKRRRITEIITKTWNIHVLEESMSPERMQVWLEPSVFNLLFRPSSPALQTLTTRCLSKSTRWKITTNPSKSRLEIYAPKAISHNILARIDKMVQSIMTKTVSCKIKGDKNRTLLDELERITNTLLQYKPKASELSISWVTDKSMRQPTERPKQKASASQRIEDPADVVLRLLLAQQANQHPNKVDILPSFEREEPVDGIMIAMGHHLGNGTLPWYHRMQQWSRHVNPASRRDRVTRPVQTCIFDKISLPNPAYKAGKGPSTNHITATFGHVLHSGPKPLHSLGKTRCLLSPVVPHPASLTSVCVGSDKPVVQSTAIILNFSPEHARGRKGSSGSGQIRLKIPVGPDCDLSNFTFSPDSTLEGVLDPWHVTDVLLPDEHVDVRLAQQRVLPLDADQSSLKEFLAMSEFNLLEGRIRTPRRAYFSIPKNWRPAKPGAIRPAKPTKLVQSITKLVKMAKAVKSPKPAKATKSAKATAMAGSDDPAWPDEPTESGDLAGPDEAAESPARTDVPFLFVSLEIHQMVDLELDGCTLRYNSIEAGHHGGRRQEISLVAVSDCHSGASEAAEKDKRFLQVVEDVAFGKLFLWHKGTKMVKDQRCIEDLDWEMVDGTADAHGVTMQHMDAGWAALPAVEDADLLLGQADAEEARGAAATEHSPSTRQMEAAKVAEPVSGKKKSPSPRKPTAARVEDPDWVAQLRSMARRD